MSTKVENHSPYRTCMDKPSSNWPILSVSSLSQPTHSFGSSSYAHLGERVEKKHLANSSFNPVSKDWWKIDYRIFQKEKHVPMHLDDICRTAKLAFTSIVNIKLNIFLVRKETDSVYSWS